MGICIGLGSVLYLVGCSATDTRVKDYVDPQLSAINQQMRTLDGRLKQTEAKMAALRLER